MVLAGTYGTGVAKYEASGDIWEPMNRGLKGANIKDASTHPTNPEIIYAGGEGLIVKSVDSGRTWQQVWGGYDSIEAMAINPHSPDTIFAVGFESWKSTDGGLSCNQMASQAGFPKHILVFEKNPQFVYVQYASGVGRSIDGGETWSEYGMSTFSIMMPYDLCGGLAMDPKHPYRLYGARYGVGMMKSKNGAYMTLDLGENWTFAGLSKRDVSCLTFSTGYPKALCAGTYSDGRGTGGVFRSTDGGSTWSELNDGLPPQHRDIWRLTSDRAGLGILLAVSFKGRLFAAQDLP